MELLVTIAIIAVLAGILVPTIVAASRQVKKSATGVEIRALETAMVVYYNSWNEYPPDSDASRNRAQCIVYYLGTTFRTDPGAGEVRASHNMDPCFDFPGDRIVQGRFIDLLGRRANYDDEEVDYYRFDNNQDDDSAPEVHPEGVDIWSAGWDGVDRVRTYGLDKDNLEDFVGDDDIDDIGNW